MGFLSTFLHQQNGKIVSDFCQFCRFFWFLETWKGNFLEKSQHFVRYRSGLGWAGLNDARPCHQVSTKRDIGSQVLMFPGFLMVSDGFLKFPRLRNLWKLKCPNTDVSQYLAEVIVPSTDVRFTWARANGSTGSTTEMIQLY